MSLVNESRIKDFRYSARAQYVNLNESLKQHKAESKYNKVTVFLSHKHDERELLDGAISLLKSQGVDIYVDWMDEDMPKHTSGETAKRIKEKIKENKKFILLASEGAINSKWCNWELGLGDADKYRNHIALLPMQKDGVVYSGAEYLQIYPFIEYESGNNLYNDGHRISAGFYVTYYNEQKTRVITPLGNWLRN
jgi:hypothetical protein